MRNTDTSVGGTMGVKSVLVALCLCTLTGCRRQQAPPAALLCYVGGTMRPAMEKLAEMYERQTGREVDLDFGDSGSNLVRIKTGRRGDLYVAHDPFLEPLLTEGFGEEAWTLATLAPVIVVPKGNPKNITGLADLGRRGVRIGLTDPQYSMLGHICPVMFAKTGLDREIRANVTSTMRMGGQLANAVAMGRFDAGIVWGAVANLRADKLDAVAIEAEHRPDPQLDAVSSATYGTIDMSRIKVFIATLSFSTQPQEARRFAEFCASERGKAVFSSLGFGPAE